MLGYAPEKEVALVTTFWKASSSRDSSFESYRTVVVGRAKEKAAAFTQSEISMREVIFAIRHEDFGASFRKLTNEYLGEDEFPLTIAELERGSAKQRRKNLVNDRKKKDNCK